MTGIMIIRNDFLKCLFSGLLLLSFKQAAQAQETQPTHTKDDLKSVKAAIESGKAVLLDVREKAEWENGHLKDAKSLPMSELTKSNGESFLKLRIDRQKIVYAHCGAGVRALKASTILKQKGYDVRALKPGFSDLLDAGFPEAK
jgi:phage shock protein E